MKNNRRHPINSGSAAGNRQRRSRPTRAGLSAWRWPATGLILGALIGGGIFIWPAASVADGTPSAPAVTRAFSLCHTGGGTNCVVDGDTIWLDRTKIRIADIDAPETHAPRCQAELDLGHRTTLRLHALVNAGPFDVKRVGNRDRDKYGRTLRVLVRDGRSLGDILVSEGLARSWDGARQPWC